MILKRKTISVAVPCYNEEGNIEELYRRVNKVMEALPEYEYEFVFIDNKSTDSSRDILKKLAANDKRVKVIFNQGNFGPGPSSAHGLLACEGDVVVGMACDLQDPPELIPQFIDRWENGSKIVLGRNPESEERGIITHFRNWYYDLIEGFCGTEGYKHVSGFGLYDKSVVDKLRESGDPCPNYRLTFMRYGYAPEYIDFKKPERTAGKSSYNFFSYFGLALESVVTVSRQPIYMIAFAGAFSAVLFAVMFIVMLVLSIVQGSAIFYGLLAASLVCLGLSLAVLALGIVGTYVALTFEWTRSAPLVIEEERLNWDKEIGDIQ